MFISIQKIFVLLLVLLFGASTVGAQVKSDTELMLNRSEHLSDPTVRNASFGVTESKKVWIKYNPVFIVAGGAMYIYQKVVSRQLSATCAFHPSCSEAGKGYVKEYGFFKGIFCTADRLTRCNKISVAEYNPSDFNKDDGKIHESVEYYK